MKLKYMRQVYEQSVIDAAIYWNAVGRGPFATRVLIRCIEMLQKKRKQLRGIAQR